MDEWQKIFKQWVAEIPGKDTRIVLLVLPHCAQVSSLCRKQMQGVGAVMDEHDSLGQLKPPFVRAIESAAKADPRVVVVFPLDAMQKAEKSGIKPYFNNDPHLSPSGQEWVGRWLCQQLKPYL